jgi:acetyl-CoA carboxylase carboxyltransferase component
MTDEKLKTMAERIDAIVTEDDRMREFDANRTLAPGQLSPRARLGALVDPGSVLELARLAHSQQEGVGSSTVGDGVITGLGTVAGHTVAVVCEDPVALAETDGQVAKNKRQRLVDHAVFRRVPLVYIADGSPVPSEKFPAGDGLLIARIADQHGARDIEERTVPYVAVVLGACHEQQSAFVCAADVVVATASGRIESGAGSLAAETFADVVAPDDATALAITRDLVELMMTRRLVDDPRTVGAGAALDDLEVGCPPDRLVAGLVDPGSLRAFGESAHLIAGVARVSGHSVALVVAGGGESASLPYADLQRISRVYALSSRFGIPLVVTQDCAGQVTGDHGADQVRLAAIVAASARTSPAVKITLVTGFGQVLGDHLLGGAGLGFDLTWAWPTATIGLRESSQPPAAPGPWAAADFGLIDDVIKPSETRAAIVQALTLLHRCQTLPPVHLDRGQLIYDVV